MDARTDGLLRIAQQQSEAQQMMEMALRATLENPHTTHRHRIHLTAVQVDGSNRVLRVAIPTGEAIDIEMSAQTAGQVARALLTPDPVEKAA
jgi:ribosome maturation factor RimP